MNEKDEGEKKRFDIAFNMAMGLVDEVAADGIDKNLATTIFGIAWSRSLDEAGCSLKHVQEAAEKLVELYKKYNFGVRHE